MHAPILKATDSSIHLRRSTGQGVGRQIVMAPSYKVRISHKFQAQPWGGNKTHKLIPGRDSLFLNNLFYNTDIFSSKGFELLNALRVKSVFKIICNKIYHGLNRAQCFCYVTL